MNGNKKVFIVLACLLLCVSNIVECGGIALAATEKSDGRNMQKFLTCYSKRQYKKAENYNKKISKIAHEKCVSKMTVSMKKAFLRVVKKYKLKSAPGEKYLWGYYLTDIDNDKKVDLLIKSGSCEGDVRFYLYQYNGGKAKQVASVEAFHTDCYAYPNHKGIVGYGGMMGEEWVWLIKLEGGKMKVKKIGLRAVDASAYLDMHGSLDAHIRHAGQGSSMVDYSDLM